MTGDQFTQKEMLQEMRTMLATHIEKSDRQHSDFLATMALLQAKQNAHEADNHVLVVKTLEDQSIREAGRKDVLKYIFGTSVIGLVCGVGGLAIGIVKLLAG